MNLSARTGRIGLAILVGSVLATPQNALGHAVQGPFKSNRCAYLKISPRKLEVRYLVAVGPVPGARMRSSADLDGNGNLSQAEQDTVREQISSRMTACFQVARDGSKIPLEIDKVDLRLDGDRTGHLPLSIEVNLKAKGAVHGSLTVTDRCRFPSPGFHEFLLLPGQTLRVDGLNGRPGATVHRGQVLFPSGSTGCRITFTVSPGSGEGGADPEAAHRFDQPSSLLWDLVRHEPSFPFLLGATLLAFLLGGYHALSPGHGKTMVAAYLVGNRATVRQALLLAGTVTFTHTFSIAILGVLVLVVFGKRVPDQVFPFLNLGAGLTIAAVGGYLLVRPARDHEHHLHDDGDPSDSNHKHLPRKATLGTLLTLGVTGGIVPCPTALVVLLLAVSQGKPLLGLYLVLIFGLGLAAVLAAIGAVAVKARSRLDRLKRAKRLMAWLPRISASVIVVVGLAIAAGPLFKMIGGR